MHGGPSLFLSIISISSKTLGHLISIWDYYPPFLIAGHVITRLLLGEAESTWGSILIAVFIRWIHDRSYCSK